VQGIGRPLYDQSADFGSSRLQSYIDMADNLHRPFGAGSAEEDFVLDILMHELMHQWGSYLQTDRPGGQPNARAVGVMAQYGPLDLYVAGWPSALNPCQQSAPFVVSLFRDCRQPVPLLAPEPDTARGRDPQAGPARKRAPRAPAEESAAIMRNA
jgi:hypothetical protein